jgi:hypothetical protein
MKEIKIGRSPDNDVCLDKNNNKISRAHLTIRQDDNGRYSLEDHSVNGTKVNGNTINKKTIPLRFDSEVRVENIKLPWLSYFGNDKQPPKPDPIPNPDPKGNEKPRNDNLNVENTIHSLFNNFKIELSNEKEYYKLVYPSLDAEICHKLQRYNDVWRRMMALLHTVQDNSKLLQTDAETVKNETIAQLNEILLQLQDNYGQFFGKYHETAETNAGVWHNLKNEQLMPSSVLLLGKNEFTVNLFNREIPITRNEYAELLNYNNLIIRYNFEVKQQSDYVANSILARILSASMSGKCIVSMVDSEDLCGTSDIFRKLNKSVYTIYSREEEISKRLDYLFNIIENRTQNLLSNSVKNLSDYNNGKKQPESYHLLVLKNFPAGLNPKSLSLLKQIMKNGVKVGVNTLILAEKENAEIEKAVKSLSANNIVKLDLPALLHYHKENGFNSRFILDNFHDELLEKIVRKVNKEFEEKPNEIVSLINFIPQPNDWWYYSSTKSVEVPFGINSEMGTVKLGITQEFGQNSAIVIGIPGSGKSIFLHTVITNAAINYSPDEIELYLIDFSGVEFDIYAQYALPHAKVIAPESEREFGISVLRRLKEEGRKREEMCRNADVNNITEYRRKNPQERMPRILVIVDEFQKFFQTDDGKFTDGIFYEAKDILTIIIREYRKFGINLILASQTMQGESIKMDMIANRIVYKCIPNDVPTFFPMGGNPTNQLKRAGECIYNSLSGDPEGNEKVQTFFISRNEHEDVLQQIKHFATDKSKTAKDTIIFRSKEVPTLLQNRDLSNFVKADIPNEVNVWLGTPIEISDKHASLTLHKEFNSNVLIIGGDAEVADSIAINSTESIINAHTNNAAMFYFFDFISPTELLYGKAKEMYKDIPFEKSFTYDNPEEVGETIKAIKEFIEYRITNKSEAQQHIYISIYNLQNASSLRSVGVRTNEVITNLIQILKDGPSVGIFTILQVDNLANLKDKFKTSVAEYFNHRVVLQMSKNDSDKLMEYSKANANTLLINNRPYTKYRAYYYNPQRNILVKFKPYKIK